MAARESQGIWYIGGKFRRSILYAVRVCYLCMPCSPVYPDQALKSAASDLNFFPMFASPLRLFISTSSTDIHLNLANTNLSFCPAPSQSLSIPFRLSSSPSPSLRRSRTNWIPRLRIRRTLHAHALAHLTDRLAAQAIFPAILRQLTLAQERGSSAAL